MPRNGTRVDVVAPDAVLDRLLTRSTHSELAKVNPWEHLPASFFYGGDEAGFVPQILRVAPHTGRP